MAFFNFFKKIGGFFSNLFSSKKFNQAVSTLSGLTEIAFPIVELVSKATVTKSDDLLLEAAKNLDTSVKDILTSANELVRDGGRQRLAAEALRLRLLELVQQDKEIQLDDFTLKTVSDVLNLDKTILLTAVQSAVFFFKRSASN